MKHTQILALVNKYKSRLEDFPPYEKNDAFYFRRTDTNEEILYLKATCDELRHGLTNYEELLNEIKKLNFDHASAKEAVIYAIKYEATRKVYHTQRKWVKKYYDSLIVSLKEHKNLQDAKKETDKLQNRITSLEKLRDTLLTQVQQKDKENDKLQNRITSLEKLRDTLLTQIKQKDKENDKLQNRITSLEKLRDQLLTQVKQKDEEIKNLQQQVNKYIKLWQQYEKKLETEKARREQLGRNNKSLGAYKGLYNKEKKKTKNLKQEIKLLNDKIKILEQQLKI